MEPIQLALKFMDIFFPGENLEKLRPLLADDFSFSGPFYQFDSAEDYIKSIEVDPPKEFQYKIIRSFEDDSSACLIYEFIKPGVSTPMAQWFEVKDGKISRILLIFDAGAFV
ncbi:MAG: hypothetical protein NPINA01_29200 [Nitrospinaceae bacterium]|nr:MAG: hypothetical protein NPINA01_29200 [Nitrospinaceae bacterium]